MGVIYKLNNEVVDFLVQSKKENPSLSCRQLVELVKEKFDVSVSKSSVNTILKKSLLSSSVGRRTVKKKNLRKFQIPQDKKQKLLDNVKRFGYGEQAKLVQPDREDQIEMPSTEMAKGIEAPKEEILKTERPVKKFLKREKVSPAKKGATPLPKGRYLENLGIVFLKAAQWERAGSSLLGKVFRDYVKPSSVKDFDAECDTLMSFIALGKEDLREIKDSKHSAAHLLNGIPEREKDNHFFDWVNAVNFSEKVFFHYSRELEQETFFIDGFEMFLEDGSSIIIDSKMISSWKNIVHPGYFSTVEGAMTTLSKRIISNNKPAVMCLLGNDCSSLQEYLGLFQAFNGDKGRKIKEITAFCQRNGAKEQIVEITTIPDMMRSLIVGVWPGQEVFKFLVEAGGECEKTSYYHRWNKKTYSIAQTKKALQNECFGSLEKQDLRIIYLREERQENEDSDRKIAPEVIILTNIRDLIEEEIVEQFILECPYLSNNSFVSSLNNDSNASKTTIIPLNLPENLRNQQETSFLLTSDAKNDENVRNNEVFAIICDFIKNLQAYSKIKFLPAEQHGSDTSLMLADTYGLPGYFIKEKHHCVFSLIINDSFKHKDVLQNMIIRINESKISDFQGKRII